MRSRTARYAAFVLALAAVLAAGAAHAAQPYDVEVYKIAVKNLKTGGTTYSEGDTLQIDCNWSVVKASETSSWAPMAWSLYIKVDGKAIHESPVEINSAFGFKVSKGFGWTWKAMGAGAHTITCGVGNPNDTDIKPGNNEKSAAVQVDATLKARAPSGPASAKPAGIFLPSPSLSVVGAQAAVEPYCQKPQPALTANVTIRNIGGPLGASKGTVYVKEFGGASLSSAGISLPAIGAGETRTIPIPAITLQPYSTLAGKHELQVLMNPVLAGGQPSFEKAAAPYAFFVVFPEGHCAKQGLRAPPGAGGARGQASPNLPAVQQPPGTRLPAVQQPQVAPNPNQPRVAPQGR